MTVLSRILDLPKFYVATQVLLVVIALAGLVASQVLAPPGDMWGAVAGMSGLGGMVWGAGWELKYGKLDHEAALAAWVGVAWALFCVFLVALFRFAFIAPELAP